MGYGLSIAPGSLNPELYPVSLSFRQKQSLYHSLAQLVRSGIPLPGALANLASRGSRLGVISGRLRDEIANGHTLGDAFARQRPEIGDLEIGIITAVERAGRLEEGLRQLSDYFGVLENARKSLWQKSRYPLFVLHFGVFALSLKTLIFVGVQPYLRETFGILALVYGLALVIALLIPILRDAGAKSAMLDGLLRSLPLVGGIRSALSTARFCATYEMQLNAGVNVIDGLQAAQRAGSSGLIRSAVTRAIPELRGGAQVGGLLAVSGAFPEPMITSFCNGELTGELDQELKRMAEEYRSEGVAKLEALAEWVPRFLYIAILVYIGYGIITFYQAYLNFALSL
jgi:general secretion pathway protein F